MSAARPGLLLFAAATLLTAACNDDDRPHLLQTRAVLTGKWTLATPPCTGICPEVLYPIYLLDIERMGDTLAVTQHSPCDGAIGDGHGSFEGNLVTFSLDCVPNQQSTCPLETCLGFQGIYDGLRVEGELTIRTHWPASGDDCPEGTTTTTLPYILSPEWPSYYCFN
jgi:hypothetical protein